MAGEDDLQAAVVELHQYLSDRIAPLMVADSMEILLQLPVRLLSGEIWKWTEQQRIAAPDVPASDFLFHAVKKVSVMGEFELVPRDALAKYLTSLGTSVLQYCPEPEKERLRQSLDRLGNAAAAPTAVPLDMLHRHGERDAGAKGREKEAAPGGVLARGLRRLSLFLERLQPQASSAATPEQRAETASQFVATAAAQSLTQQELDEHLAALRKIGVPAEPEHVFRTLASSLPGWGALPAASGQAPPPVTGTEITAMRQVVSLAEDPAEAAKRFRELVHAAIEQFNGGHLGRAVAMFELAEQLVAEKKVQPIFVEALRTGGSEYLDPDRLRKVVDRTDSRPGLRTILNFFSRFQADGLLQALDGEPSRDRRHQLLALLEVHGLEARARALELLRASVAEGSQVDPYFQMNLVYLLRVVPRPADAPVEDEINLVMSTPNRASPPPLVKQVIAYLAGTRHDKAERALITYLRLFENMLLQPDTATYEQQDVEVLLERVCAALARYASPRAWRALVDHGLRPELRLGSSLGRLVEAGRHDLSASADLVERLVTALKAELPRTVMGFTVKKNEERITSLIQALSGTPAPEVQKVFQEIADKYPGDRIGEAASKGLASLRSAGKPAEPAAGLSGDLELFGLPGVLQTLSQPHLTGVLSLVNAAGKPEATVLFEGGKLRSAQFGNIRGEEAIYQLFERPFSGTFAFVSRAIGEGSGAAPLEVLQLILEGVRRHDEFKRAAALVPDRAALRPTGQASTPLSDEDEDFIHYVWGKIAAGTTAADCEASIATDSYRVRRLLAHWVEEGALAVAPAA